MTDQKTKQREKQDHIREKRRAEQLRANLMRRKAQIRSRRAGDEDDRRDGIAASSSTTTTESVEKSALLKTELHNPTKD